MFSSVLIRTLPPHCRIFSIQWCHCKELTHWKIPWCWEGLGAGREGDDRGWDGWMASPTRWTWVWVNSGSWWWTGRPCVLWFMGLQRVGNDWVTELNWCHWIIVTISDALDISTCHLRRWLLLPLRALG